MDHLVKRGVERKKKKQGYPTKCLRGSSTTNIWVSDFDHSNKGTTTTCTPTRKGGALEIVVISNSKVNGALTRNEPIICNTPTINEQTKDETLAVDKLMIDDTF